MAAGAVPAAGASSVGVSSVALAGVASVGVAGVAAAAVPGAAVAVAAAAPVGVVVTGALQEASVASTSNPSAVVPAQAEVAAPTPAAPPVIDPWLKIPLLETTTALGPVRPVWLVLVAPLTVLLKISVACWSPVVSLKKLLPVTAPAGTLHFASSCCLMLLKLQTSTSRGCEWPKTKLMPSFCQFPASGRRC